MIEQITDMVTKNLNIITNSVTQLDGQRIAKRVSKVKTNKIGVFQPT
jgi:hypothetical protein